MQTIGTLKTQRTAVTVLAYLLLCLVGIFTTAVCRAQTTQQFTGRVVDSTGAVVPAADVVVHNENTGGDTKTVTTKSGDYTVPYLIPGTYDISVSKDGFKTAKKTSITLNVDQVSTIDFALQIGAVTETVTVNASNVQLELSKADNGMIIEGERVTDLPLDALNPFDLFDLAPGTHDFSQLIYPRPFDNTTGNQYVNGSPQVSELNIDGVGNDAGDLGRYAFVPTTESVGEFKIVLNAYDASYGHSGGSSVDMQIKSGGNQFHGAAYYYMRRAWLDDGNWQAKYNNTPPFASPHLRNQWGLEGDGPVRIPHLYNGKDKLFYTLSWERMRDILPNNAFTVYSLPNPDWLKGNFGPTASSPNGAQFWDSTTSSLQPLIIYDPLTPLVPYVDPNNHNAVTMRHSAFPGNIIPTNRIDGVGATVLSYYNLVCPPAQFAYCNVNPGPGYAPWTNNYDVLNVENDLWYNGMIKIDWKMSAKDSFAFRFGGQGRFDKVNSGPGYSNSDPANQNGDNAQPKTLTGTVNWTHVVSPNLMFNFAADIMTYYNTAIQGPQFPGNEDAALGFAPAYYNQLMPTVATKFPTFTFSGMGSSGNSYGPLGGTGGYSGNDHALDLLPTLTYIHGAHSIRAGVNIDFYQQFQSKVTNVDNYSFTNNFTSEYDQAVYSEGPGWYSGNSIASALLGYPNAGNARYIQLPFYSQHYIAPWVQDDWKITKDLTLNLGLRWDFMTPQQDRFNRMDGAFNYSVVNPVSASIPLGTAALGNATTLTGGQTFAGVNGVPRGAYYTNMLNLQPRMGFAYRINDRMTLRGGLGLNYMADHGNGPTAYDGTTGFSTTNAYGNSVDNGVTPYTACPQGTATPGYPNCTGGLGLADPIPVVTKPLGSSLGYLLNLGNSVSYYNPHYQLPRFWDYSLWYQYAVSKRDVVSVGYVGNRIPNNPVTYNQNLISPQWNALCDVERTPYYGSYTSTNGVHNYCDQSATGQVANPFKGIAAFAGTSDYTAGSLSKSVFTEPHPEFGNINESGATNEGRHWYNSIQATADHRMSHSLTLHATYTHAKSMTAGGWIDQLNQVRTRQLEGSNTVRHSVNFSGVGYLPFGKNQAFLSKSSYLVNALVSGWEIAPIYTYYSGFAFLLGSTWEDPTTGGPVSNKLLKVPTTILPPDGQHKNFRIRAMSPCVGSKDANSGAIIPSAAALAANCTTILAVTNPNSTYAVGRNNESTGVDEQPAHIFDVSLSKSVPLPGNRYLGENFNLKLRCDMFNAINHANWDNIGYNTSSTGLDFGTIGKGPSAPNNTPRYLQLSARLSW